MKRDYQPARQYVSGDLGNKGFRKPEASQLIEFCVDLDSQDDRLHSQQDARYIPNIDPSLWNPKPVFDSRNAVAKDVAAFRTTGVTPENAPWAKLYREIIDRIRDAKEPSAIWKPESLATKMTLFSTMPGRIAT